MRTIRIALFACLAACSTSAAWAQYGLYGSPETLRVAQQPTYQAQAYPASADYPATATPMAQPATAPASYPAQPQYRYPAQAPATYQPYQPGAQYRYPGPYATRPPVRTAAVEQPAMPEPMPVPEANYAPAPQAPGMMNQMLAEQGCYGGDNGSGSCGAYRGAVNGFQQSAEGCGSNGACGQAYYSPWYASAYALVMGRSDGRRFWTSFDDSDVTHQLSNTQFPMAWKWGGEVRFGRRFCCDCTTYALEATYWTTEPFTGTQCTTNPGGLVSTPLCLNDLTFNGASADNWFMGAQQQSVTRRDEFHNVEVNLIREQLAWACNSPWDIGWSVGVRYFRFQEGLTFDSVAFDGVSNAYFSDDITNNLVGVQFGFDAAYCVGNGVRLFITPKIGIYDNFLDSTFQEKARVGNGAYCDGRGPYGDFPAHGTTTSLSFLTQVDVGAEWQFSRCWSARAGYRVVCVTGMGLADDQFPQYMCDKPEIENIQHTSSLVLHGAFFGVTYNF